MFDGSLPTSSPNRFFFRTFQLSTSLNHSLCNECPLKEFFKWFDLYLTQKPIHIKCNIFPNFSIKPAVQLVKFRKMIEKFIIKNKKHKVILATHAIKIISLFHCFWFLVVLLFQLNAWIRYSSSTSLVP